ncbi:MAG: DNA photolyase [Methylococcales symbiont of Hymedesmia sp. n. MRB-2018]|nr:MAG: DNA photolyase [Methylococcales symbiont of Hymedesmia sp. n. MRB-2018]
MIDTLYIEESVRHHPRTLSICQRFPHARIIFCERYGEVFNPKAQNFRLQKQNPALIIAEKFNHFALAAPLGYGIGATKNYYFSHIYNCLYDCRYCFLQGMYQSANYVFFINYEDFQAEIKQICAASPAEPIHFFSGYDCDSLALEPVTRFAEHFLPFFAQLPNAWLELRTKSTQIRSLLNTEAYSRCIVAFSLSPDDIAQKVEDKAPTLERRLQALCKLQEHGWSIGLRFDPLIYQTDYQQQYKHFFEQVFSRISLDSLHSVSLGVFRLPEKYFKKIHKLYPEEKLFSSPLETRNKMTSYKTELEQEMLQYCTEHILSYIPQSKFFPCTL